MPTVSTLTVRISANSAKFVKELNMANRRAKTFGSKVKASLGVVSNAFAGMSLAATASLLAIANQSINAADQLAKLRDRLGVSVESLSELKFAAEQSGVSFNTLALGMQRLQRRVAEAAQGTGEAQAALRELGISATSLVQLPLEQQLRVVADRLQLVGTDADRTRLAFKLFDSEGVALLQTLKDGSKGLDDYAKKARTLGAVINDETADKAAEARDRLNEMKTAFQALGNNAIPIAAKSLGEFANAINQLFFSDDYDKTLREYAAALDNLERVRNARGSGARGNQLREAQAEVDRLAAELERLRDLRFAETLEEIDPAKYTARVSPVLSAIAESYRKMREEIQRTSGIQEIDISGYLERAAKIREDSRDRAREALLQSREQSEAFREFGFTMESAFENAIIQGNKLRDVMKGLFQDIVRIIARNAVVNPLASLISGGVSSIFDGFRANGGPVTAGKAYMVGERGKEMFVPNTSGTIVPNNALGGSVVFNNTYNIAQDAELRRFLPTFAEQVKRNTMSEIKSLQLQGRW